MNCSICFKPVSEAENRMIYNGSISHLCCYAFYVACEIDNTMMVFGINMLGYTAGITPAFEKARKSFREAFSKTFPERCEHRPDWKGWPWGSQ